MKLIRHFRKYHNYLFAPLPPPPKKEKKCITIVFNFSWELKTMVLQKFLLWGWGGDKKIIIIFPKVVNGNTFFVM